MDIPAGLHVQSNKPLDKFLVPTKLEVETPSGMKVGPVSYPRAVMRKLKFSKGMVAVYEGQCDSALQRYCARKLFRRIGRNQRQTQISGVQ